MKYETVAAAAAALGCMALILPASANALDIGGQNGVSIGSNSSGGLGVSVGGASGVNANVGGTSNRGLGVNASVSGSGGVNSNTTVGGSGNTGGLRANTAASIGGSDGVNAEVDVKVGGKGLATANAKASMGGLDGVSADVDADVGGSRLATAGVNVGSGGNTLLNLVLGIPATTAPTTSTIPGSDSSGGSATSSRIGNPKTIAAINDMTDGDRAKAKLKCKDVLRSGGYEASLTKLCKMVVALR